MIPPNGMGRHLMDPMGASIEIVYLVIISALLLLIYFKTKEIYQLTGHKGIKYFRYSFLFFLLAFVFRAVTFVIRFFLSGEGSRQFHGFMQYGLIIAAFTSSMAILFLALSMLYKYLWKKVDWGIMAFVISIVFTILVFLTHSPEILALSQAVLLLIVLGVSSLTLKRKKSLFIIYFLVFLFWISNLALLAVPRFSLEFRVIVYLFQIGIFGIILYKVLRITK